MRCNTDPAIQAFCSNENSQNQDKKEVIVGISNTSDLMTLPYRLREEARLEITNKTMSDLSVRVKKLEGMPTQEKEDEELLSFTKQETKELQSLLNKTKKPAQENVEKLLEITNKTMSVLSKQIKALENQAVEDDDEDAEFLLFIQKEQEELQSKLDKVKKTND